MYPEIMNEQERLKNEALDLLEETRESLVAAGRAAAIDLSNKNGRVTSTEVLVYLRQQGLDPDAVDKRFMGAVFRKGFTRIGYEPTGSHSRPVSIWVFTP